MKAESTIERSLVVEAAYTPPVVDESAQQEQTHINGAAVVEHPPLVADRPASLLLTSIRATCVVFEDAVDKKWCRVSKRVHPASKLSNTILSDRNIDECWRTGLHN